VLIFSIVLLNPTQHPFILTLAVKIAAYKPLLYNMYIGAVAWQIGGSHKGDPYPYLQLPVAVSAVTCMGYETHANP
jgi:hypothetical protein